MSLQLRDASPEELTKHVKCSFPPGWCRVVDEQGEITGYVCASVIEGKAWLHELHYWGKSPDAVTRMIRAAIRYLKSEGFSSILVNTYNDNVRQFLERHGFKTTQTIMKGDIKNGRNRPRITRCRNSGRDQ